MGRKSGSWITARDYSVLETDREEIIDRLWAGETLKALALELNTCRANMHRWV